MKTFEVNGTYGSQFTPCTVFVVQQGQKKWYACEGSVNVNCTLDDIQDGIDVEELIDVDMFTWPKGIHSLKDLELAVES